MQLKISHKAVGLLSGGLDSAVACRLMQDQGFDVHVVHIHMPWGCSRPHRVKVLCEALGVPLTIIPLGDDYLSVLKSPRYGFGNALNPCIDCHIYMVKKAAEHMRAIGAAFVFTGEILGQRSMSQRRGALEFVERGGGIPGRLVRPLCAQHLEPTIPEIEGIVDRSRLLDLAGRSRATQLALVKQWGLTGFGAPGGGCLLTEKHFGARLKDVLTHGCDSIAETNVLGLGRYFRLDETTFVLLGRNNDENDKLAQYALPGDVIFRSHLFPGPAALLRGLAITDGHKAQAAGFVQFFSKFRDEAPLEVLCWYASTPDDIFEVTAVLPAEAVVRKALM